MIAIANTCVEINLEDSTKLTQTGDALGDRY